MKNIPIHQSNSDADFFIDITSEVCPLTFVKTKLLIERMAVGQTAEVRLKGREPLENVPRSVTDHGHVVMSLEPESPDGDEFSVHRLHIQKT